MAQVEIRDLVKVYPERKGNGFTAVNKVNLSIKDREFMVLVGPSGCGKSTTLRMIAGLEEITDGTISIDDRVINDVQPKDRDIAMVFQNYALYPHMSVYDNMAFGLKLRKFSKEEIDKRVRDAAQILGIEQLLERKPKALSGGQRQRVAVGRAIVRKPKVFLFDEPLSNLDAKMRVSTRTEISKLHARLSTTMIYVTHDQVEAMTMGDRICVMKDGNIMQVAEPLELYNQPANMFVAGFIGSPPMNFIKGTIEQQAGDLYFKEAESAQHAIRIRFDDTLSKKATDYVDSEVVFGIRPEDVYEVSVAPEAERSASATVRIEVAEPMGNETFLYLESAQNSFIGRMRSNERYGANDEIEVCFDLSKAHLFDPKTEKVIS
ncbi:MAG: sn-glycerol-3-phosphate ABC transporter ATP-binding protein UgpC [Symploca sp. SIO2D2]|nr:sn-glycerol-3-phosphate ABC transporter ATP-binding protein UgpC [Symploca sp. SIO2D2]